MKQGYNSNYQVASYHLPEDMRKVILEELRKSNLPEEAFLIQKIENFEVGEDQNLMNQPEILLIHENEPITEEMRAYAIQNLTQIVRVTEHSLEKGKSFIDLMISINQKPFEKHPRGMGNPRITSELQEGVSFLRNLAQMVNMTKLKYLGTEVLRESELVPLENKDAVIQSLLKLNKLLRLKDSYTVIHSNHVAEYGVMIGREAGLTVEQLELIRIGGKLHDIGKVGIPDVILQKTLNLTEEEFEIMKHHTIIGSEILPSEGYQEIKDMIRHHHERLDGKGYPDELKGEQIPYFARILSVADTFDAMTTQRSYNARKTLEEAFVELRRAATPVTDSFGEITQQLDPVLVEYFLKGFAKNEKLLEEFQKQDEEILRERQKDRFLMK